MATLSDLIVIKHNRIDWKATDEALESFTKKEDPNPATSVAWATDMKQEARALVKKHGSKEIIAILEAVRK